MNAKSNRQSAEPESDVAEMGPPTRSIGNLKRIHIQFPLQAEGLHQALRDSDDVTLHVASNSRLPQYILDPHEVLPFLRALAKASSTENMPDLTSDPLALISQKTGEGTNSDTDPFALHPPKKLRCKKCGQFFRSMLPPWSSSGPTAVCPFCNNDVTNFNVFLHACPFFRGAEFLSFCARCFDNLLTLTLKKIGVVLIADLPKEVTNKQVEKDVVGEEQGDFEIPISTQKTDSMELKNSPRVSTLNCIAEKNSSHEEKQDSSRSDDVEKMMMRYLDSEDSSFEGNNQSDSGKDVSEGKSGNVHIENLSLSNEKTEDDSHSKNNGTNVKEATMPDCPTEDISIYEHIPAMTEKAHVEYVFSPDMNIEKKMSLTSFVGEVGEAVATPQRMKPQALGGILHTGRARSTPTNSFNAPISSGDHLPHEKIELETHLSRTEAVEKHVTFDITTPPRRIPPPIMKVPDLLTFLQQPLQALPEALQPLSWLPEDLDNKSIPTDIVPTDIVPTEVEPPIPSLQSLLLPTTPISILDRREYNVHPSIHMGSSSGSSSLSYIGKRNLFSPEKKSSKNSQSASTALPSQSRSRTRNDSSKDDSAEKEDIFCEECGASFKKSENLRRHLLVHSSTGKHICTECKARFVTARGLTKHYATVCKSGKVEGEPSSTDEGTWRGSSRGRRKGSGGRKSNGGKGPVECMLCGKIFTLRNSLQRHVKVVHMQERDFECQICERKFSTKYNMQVHVMNIHGEEGQGVGDYNVGGPQLKEESSRSLRPGGRM